MLDWGTEGIVVSEGCHKKTNGLKLKFTFCKLGFLALSSTHVGHWHLEFSCRVEIGPVSSRQIDKPMGKKS